jgi:hypothetical protein
VRVFVLCLLDLKGEFDDILRQLIADERMLCPGGLVERESHAGVVEGLADEVAALRRDVGVFFAEDLCGVCC